MKTLAQSDGNTPLDPDDIQGLKHPHITTRELHRQLLGQVWSWAGQFRTTEKNIGIDPRQMGATLRRC